MGKHVFDFWLSKDGPMNWHPRSRLIAGIAFLRECARSPRAIGAICPSSRLLAQKMAAKINPQGSGLIVELGAGTGKVTEALLSRGISPGRLLIVERAQAFCDILRNKFPGLNIICGDAAKLSSYIARPSQVDSIVSSLPFASLDEAIALKIITEIKKIIGSGNLLQYTYALSGSHLLARNGFTCIYSHRVWFNLPPATTMEFVL